MQFGTLCLHSPHIAVCTVLNYFFPHYMQDQYWNKLLWHCVDNDSYQGCALPEKRLECVDNYPTYEDRVDYDGGPVTNEANWCDGWQPSSSGEVGWDHPGSSQAEIPEPVIDEAEWSDGWQ